MKKNRFYSSNKSKKRKGTKHPAAYCQYTHFNNIAFDCFFFKFTIFVFLFCGYSADCRSASWIRLKSKPALGCLFPGYIPPKIIEIGQGCSNYSFNKEVDDGRLFPVLLNSKSTVMQIMPSLCSVHIHSQTTSLF